MQRCSIIKSKRRNKSEVWEFRWRDRTSSRPRYRRIVLGSTEEFPTEAQARSAAGAIVVEINRDDRLKAPLTLAQLATHYEHRELSPDTRGRLIRPKLVIGTT
jgi:hypothetical protein